MTVLADEGILSNGKQVVTCEWLDNGELKRDLFLAVSLELMEGEVPRGPRRPLPVSQRGGG